MTRINSTGYVGSDFARVENDTDLEIIVQLKDEYTMSYNQLLSLQKRINQLRRKYKLSSEFKK